MGIGKRLSTSTADLTSALPAGEAVRNDEEKTVLARTAPGQMLAIHTGMAALQIELQVLQDRLKRFDGGLVTRHIDPNSVRPTRWANRHEASFATPAFASLKESIALAGGNAQPILVREHLPDQYEIVFGHRRHRACLELGVPVLAAVAEQSLGDIEVFLSMERENRERADLSPYEQGQSYVSALDAGLFPSLRRLAEAVGWTTVLLGFQRLGQPRRTCEPSARVWSLHSAREVFGTAYVAREAARRSGRRNQQPTRVRPRKAGSGHLVEDKRHTRRQAEEQQGRRRSGCATRHRGVDGVV